MTEFPQADNNISVEIGIHLEALFIKCPESYFASKIELDTLADNFLSYNGPNSNGQLRLTHLNSQTPEYWEQLAQWFREQLNPSE